MNEKTIENSNNNDIHLDKLYLYDKQIEVPIRIIENKNAISKSNSSNIQYLILGHGLGSINPSNTGYMDDIW